jgi:hypothetical protein
MKLNKLNEETSSNIPEIDDDMWDTSPGIETQMKYGAYKKGLYAPDVALSEMCKHITRRGLHELHTREVQALIRQMRLEPEVWKYFQYWWQRYLTSEAAMNAPPELVQQWTKLVMGTQA